MKKLNVLSMAFALTLAVAPLASAGEIWIPAPPPPPSASPLAEAPGIMDTPGDIHIPGSPGDSVTEAALNLLQSLLSVI